MTAPGGFFGRAMAAAKHRRANPRSFKEALPGLTQTTLGEISRTRQQGAGAEAEFFRRSMEFDPQAAAEASAGGIAESLSRQLNRNLTDAQGAAVGGGRLDTGFFDEDRGRLFEDFNERLASAVASQALQAQQLNLANIQGIGRFGESISNRFVNLLGGATQAGVQEQSAENQRGGLFGKILGGIGGLVLPGIGSAVGEFVGNKITGN